MSIGFRSFLSVDEGESLIDTVVQHVQQWADVKEVDVPADAPGRSVRSQNDIITVLREGVEGGEAYRWRRDHPLARSTSEIRRTSITAVESPDRPGWIWTEIEVGANTQFSWSSHSTFMSVPGFLRSLIATLPCSDGKTPAAAEPQWITPGHLPDMMDYLADDSRRGPVLVASQATKPEEELQEWATEASWELVGLGSMFLLSQDAEPEFNEMVGRHHAVFPGTVRTYAPNLNLDDPDDSRRHRTLSRERIESSTARRIAHMLGLAQRDRASRIPVPDEIQAVHQVLTLKEDDLVTLSSLPNGAAAPAPAFDGHGAHKVSNGWTVTPQRVAHTEPALWSETDESVRALQAQNAQLRQQVELLTQVAHSYQTCEAAIITAIQALGEEMKMIRSGAAPNATNGAQHTAAAPRG
ncbi:hypothetical protein [Phytoactinopolyspora mesophila]|uniref:Uncharacterized protein n=1 Tax=Phytoactinopolyspora mesophila TaxID=2650750 RepID=A0A7K3M031_9ACTN|nr:hypothetical protein [Phytoactinopolyspora mesophila]NDL56646.1 hypothetical protein [Phytoactinopolyspora mesophila]